jgi:hypothetical protein
MLLTAERVGLRRANSRVQLGRVNGSARFPAESEPLVAMMVAGALSNVVGDR